MRRNRTTCGGGGELESRLAEAPLVFNLLARLLRPRLRLASAGLPALACRAREQAACAHTDRRPESEQRRLRRSRRRARRPPQRGAAFTFSPPRSLNIIEIESGAPSSTRLVAGATKCRYVASFTCKQLAQDARAAPETREASPSKSLGTRRRRGRAAARLARRESITRRSWRRPMSRLGDHRKCRA